MAKKDNFNKAMYDMFGVGSDGTQQTYEKVEQKQAGGLTNDVMMGAAGGSMTERTYIGRGTVFEGSITSKGDVEVAGECKGDITSEGKVTLHTPFNGNVTAAGLMLIGSNLTGDVHIDGSFVVGHDSAIDGGVFASEVTCAGTITGNIEVGGLLTLEKSAIINGDIKAGFMSMARGAVVHGNLELTGEAE